jgi:DNA-binding NarL/FixJ family response regulator
MTGTGGQNRRVKLLLADDHQMLRAGLRKLLETQADFSVVGEAGDGAEAVALVRTLQPDVLLLDLAMPKMPGLEALRELATPPTCRIILLAAAIERAQVIEALQLGARGVVLKHSAIALLFKSIRRVMSGEYWVGRESVADLVSHLRRPASTERAPVNNKFNLTQRELQIVTTVVGGCSNKDIAQNFRISEDTVKHHLSSIFDKLGVSTRLELALFAISHQVVPEP